MWLTSSSIGRKFVMALTGICLVLFVTFHCLMNSVAIFWPAAYNAICQFLGANWYALVASMGLAALFIIHIIYALWLTVQNRKARGADRYEVNGSIPEVEWSSKNMLVLGIVVLAFLALHLIQFWAKMQLQELRSHELSAFPMVEGGIPADPQFGTLFLQMAFSQWWTPVVYVIGFIALWFHMNHGFWSMFQTIGWNNQTWLPRLKSISCWWTSIVILLFVAQAAVFTWRANEKYYTTDPALVDQYIESLAERATPAVHDFIPAYNDAMHMAQATGDATPLVNLINEKGDYYLSELEPIANAAAQFPAAANNETIAACRRIVEEVKGWKEEIAAQAAQTAQAAAAPGALVPEADADATEPAAAEAPAEQTETTNE